MSWDIFVQDLPSTIQRVQDIPDDFQPGPIGRRSEVIAEIKALVPETDFSDASWGCIEGPDFSIEINMGDEEALQSFAFHVRGGDGAVGVVAAILDRLGFRALDPSSETGIFQAGKAARESFARWQSYRDTAIGESEA